VNNAYLQKIFAFRLKHRQNTFSYHSQRSILSFKTKSQITSVTINKSAGSWWIVQLDSHLRNLGKKIQLVAIDVNDRTLAQSHKFKIVKEQLNGIDRPCSIMQPYQLVENHIVPSPSSGSSEERQITDIPHPSQPMSTSNVKRSFNETDMSATNTVQMMKS